jgi:hypothetical protein
MEGQQRMKALAEIDAEQFVHRIMETGAGNA